MTFLVPFDGSALSEAALVRAVQFSECFEDDVLAVSVIPHQNASYARERGWLESGESFDFDRIVSRLREQVADVAPDAEFRHVLVDRSAPAGTIANRLRRTARQEGASMMFVGSDNAGRIVRSVASVGAKLSSVESYDVVIVRSATGPASRGPTSHRRNR